MMTPDSAAGENFVHFFPRIRRWALWSLNGAAIFFIGFVIAAACVVTAAGLRWGPPIHSASLVRFAVLLLAAISYGEAFDRIERVRRFLGDDRVRTNHLSVWTIAGVIALPSSLACALVPCLYFHLLIMVRRHQSARLHRMLFTAAAATLATAGAAQMLTLISAPTQLGDNNGAAISSVMVIATFLLLDTAIVAIGVYLAMRPPSVRAVLPDREGLWFELSTQILGVVTGELLLHMPWLVPASAGGLVALHRASLVKHLEFAATTDTKTALLNASAWRDRAAVAVARAVAERMRIAIVVIDLDHFKRINDAHGHLVGDRVLADVGRAIRAETRTRDIVGRFGGEEFVVLIDGRAAAAHAIDIATRIRERIAALRHPEGMQVTATIGVTYGVPSASAGLEQLIARADAALYEGKSAGRDRINALALS